MSGLLRSIVGAARKPRVLAAAAGLFLSCGRPAPPPELVHFWLHEKAGHDVDFTRVAWPAAVREARVLPFGVALAVDRTALHGSLTLSAPGLCPVILSEHSNADVEVRQLFTAQIEDPAQVGFDAPFTIVLNPGCREALAGKIEWTQTEGAKLSTRVEKNGFVLHGKTLPLAAPVPDGIVPLSPRTRGSYAFRAHWTGAAGSSDVEVKLASAARSAGLPSVALGTRVLLGGGPWHVQKAPPLGRAEVEERARVSTFRPDARGRWELANAKGDALVVMSGLHSETPLDCGRSECHRKETEAAQGSAMTSVFHRGVLGALPDHDPSCTLGCHTVGEPGLADGGFDAIRRELGFSTHFRIGRDAWDALPRALRRLGGVTCTGCHGPGAIPEPSARWAVLRSDVCAVCHDAPPKYRHVAAWQRTRMARADADGDARRGVECRGCHTTAGFLERQGLRKPDPLAPDVPIGLGCATCHAAHGPSVGVTLLRKVTLRAGLEVPDSAATSRVCVTCHDGADASAATLVFGSAKGEKPPHAELGCVGCHGALRPRGDTHDFTVVSPKACTQRCHEGGVPTTPDVLGRARALYEKLGGPPLGKRPPHAEPNRTLPSGALEKVLRVLEDPAAGVHNPAYAKALLDAAEAEAH